MLAGLLPLLLLLSSHKQIRTQLIQRDGAKKRIRRKEQGVFVTIYLTYFFTKDKMLTAIPGSPSLKDINTV